MAEIDPIGPQEELQPAAEPVSTYTQPPAAAPSNLGDLADALSNFSGDLKGFMKDRQAKLDDADKVRGEAAGLEANGAGYTAGVQNGSIPANNSPVFVKAYKASQGEILGKQIASGAVDAYQTWGGRNSQDPNDFDNNFIGPYIKQHLGSITDPDVLSGALPYVKSSADALFNANEKDRSEQLYQSSVQTHIASSSMDVDNEQDLALSQGRLPDYGTMWQGLMSDRSQALASGIRADDYDKSLKAMVQAKALEFMDPATLGMLKNKVPGQTYSYDDEDGSASTEDTLNTMTSRQATVDRLKLDQQTAADKVTKDQNTSFVIQTLGKNPNAVFPDGFIAQAQKYDPTLPIQIKEWSKDLSAATPENPQDIMGIQQQVLAGGGVDVIEKAMGPGGVIHDPATLSSLFTLAQNVGSDDMKPVLENNAVKKGLDYIQNALGQGDFDPTGLKGISPDAIQAQTDFLNSMYAWKEANPNARYDEIANQATTTLARIQKGFPQAAGVPAGGVPAAPGATTPEAAPGYQRPAEVTQELATQPAANPDGTPNANAGSSVLKPTPEAPLTPNAPNTGAPAADDARMAPWRGNAPPKITDLSPDQQSKINDRAAEQGVDPSVIINEVYQHGRGLFVAPLQKQGAAIDNPTFKTNDFRTYADSIKGLANNYIDGHMGPIGDPTQPAWQQANLTTVPLGTNDQGKPISMTVNKQAASAFQGFLGDLKASGYPVNNVGGFNVRSKIGGTTLSEHAYGMAIDVNGETAPGETAPRNQYSKNGDGGNLVTNLPPNVADLAAKWGLTWGGDWHSAKDAMHFEYVGKPPDFAATGATDHQPTDETNSMQNNNPGSIKFFPGEEQKYAGNKGPSTYTDQGVPQIVFDNQQDGLKAIAQLAMEKAGQGMDTVRKLISDPSGWTPGKLAGAEGVAKLAGVGLDDKLDLSNPETLVKIMRGIVTQENGARGAAYTDNQLLTAANSILKGEPQQ